MENRSTSQLQADQKVLVKIEHEIKNILPKLQEFQNVLKVEELQLKSNVLSATIESIKASAKEEKNIVGAPETSSSTAFDLAKETSAKIEDVFEINQQDIMLDMVSNRKTEEEEEEDDV